ncbi:hypothetical protein [Dechloromonas hortensis]|uniref:hypothetical protein n=1 Tax=Dechloromonas hortensis TaxID=337779 RepID=UPI0014784A0B|nr:hypothetical protein [Dechloromonas hortensis]
MPACAYRDLKLHLYGKHYVRPGRKMGHMTVLDKTLERPCRFAMEARAAIGISACRD